MKLQNVVRAFLASPGDAAPERQALSEVVEELNLTWSDFVGIRVDLIKWESHSVPASGPDPQAAINRQRLGDDRYEIFIGILKGRLGTPTPRAASGTVEEFERAYARYSATGLPEIMFYLHPTVERKADTSKFKKRLEDLGVFYWRYDSDRQFEQACRLHLSRQIQSVARGDFARSAGDRAFPSPEVLDLSTAFATVTSLLQNGKAYLERYMERCNELKESSHQVKFAAEAFQNKLGQLGRPGFRQPKGGKSRAIGDFARKLKDYGLRVDKLSREMMIPYSAGLEAYSKALSIIAPMAPLPMLFKSSVQATSRTFGFAGRSLSELRASADKGRNAIARWDRIEESALRKAWRLALNALDSLDLEITHGLHLTREVERLTEEFLEEHDGVG